MHCVSCERVISGESRFCNYCGQPTPTGSVEPDEDGGAVGTIRTGDVLDGKYRIVGKLGAGGMGSVYRAHDLLLDRAVAVKALAPELCRTPEYVARFEREARVTAGFDHPNVIPIYAVGRIDRRPYMVMKLLEGTTLSQLLAANRGGMPLAEVVRLVDQICAGLAHIHDRGFVHRDIKSSNIVVTADGNAMILDFGILRDLGNDMTRTGAIMGTPRYMSPEQARGARELDHRADLYALGVVLFELLTGSAPFDGDSDLAIIHKHVSEPVPDASELSSRVPAAVARVAARALAKSPDERFQSAAALAHALREALAAPDDAAEAPPRRTAPSAPAASKPRGAALGLGLAALVAILGAVGLLTRGGGDGQASPAVEPASRPVSPPPAPVVAVPPVETAPARPEAPVPALAPAPPAPDVAPRQQPPKRPTRPAQVRAPPAPASAPPVEEKPQSPGTLKVITTSGGGPVWASVKIDGVPHGETPLVQELPAGAHTVLVERAGFRTITKNIRLGGGETLLLRLELQP